MKARTHVTRFTIVMALAVLAVGVFAGAAMAVDPTTNTTAELTGGTLSVSTELTAGTFAVTMTGLTQTLDASVAGGGSVFSGFSICDPRGTGVGWSVTMVASQFANQEEGFDGKDIALDSLTMPKLAVAKADTDSSDVPGTLHDAATIDTGGAGVVMAACSAFGQGMGTYNFTADSGTPWKLAITADEFAGTYQSTITTTLATLALVES